MLAGLGYIEYIYIYIYIHILGLGCRVFRVKVPGFGFKYLGLTGLGALSLVFGKRCNLRFLRARTHVRRNYKKK